MLHSLIQDAIQTESGMRMPLVWLTKLTGLNISCRTSTNASSFKPTARSPAIHSSSLTVSGSHFWVELYETVST